MDPHEDALARLTAAENAYRSAQAALLVALELPYNAPFFPLEGLPWNFIPGNELRPPVLRVSYRLSESTVTAEYPLDEGARYERGPYTVFAGRDPDDEYEDGDEGEGRVVWFVARTELHRPGL